MKNLILTLLILNVTLAFSQNTSVSVSSPKEKDKKCRVEIFDLTGDPQILPGVEMYNYGSAFESFKLSKNGTLSTIPSDDLVDEKFITPKELELTKVKLYQLAAKYSVVKNRDGESLCLTLLIKLNEYSNSFYLRMLPDTLDQMAREGESEAPTIKEVLFGSRI